MPKKNKNKGIETVGDLQDAIAKLPRGMKLWAGVPKPGGGFEPCLTIRFVNADPKGKPGRDDCGLILDASKPYSNLG
jgi:hypothetical protein